MWSLRSPTLRLLTHRTRLRTAIVTIRNDLVVQRLRRSGFRGVVSGQSQPAECRIKMNICFHSFLKLTGMPAQALGILRHSLSHRREAFLLLLHRALNEIPAEQ